MVQNDMNTTLGKDYGKIRQNNTCKMMQNAIYTAVAKDHGYIRHKKTCEMMQNDMDTTRHYAIRQ